MKKLIYEDINLKTHFTYEIYSSGYRLTELKYLVYECDQDGNRKFIRGFNSYDEARSFVRMKVTQ